MRILLLAPSFFGYRDKVLGELSRQGHDVDVLDDRPTESVAFKSLAKVGYQLVDFRIAAYAKQVRRKAAASKYDLFLYMGGMSFCFTREQFLSVREASGARFVAYLWDSFSNCQRFGSCRDLFDEVYSFEPSDCNEFGLRLRPLFYSDAYSAIPRVPEDGFAYDACFIGSVHQPSKFKAVRCMCGELERMGRRVFTYFYMPSKSAAALRRCTDPAFRSANFQFKPLTAVQVSDVYAHSKAVIDSPQAGQGGLTMRTVETVGSRRKLITANSDVVNYDFAWHGDVAVWDKDCGIPGDLFERPYTELPSDVYDSYSISAFARTLIGEGESFSGYERGNR